MTRNSLLVSLPMEIPTRYFHAIVTEKLGRFNLKFKTSVLTTTVVITPLGKLLEKIENTPCLQELVTPVDRRQSAWNPFRIWLESKL